MECATRFLEALSVELQGVKALRLVWCQRSGTVWLSGGMRRRFGFNTTSLDQLAYWGLSHPDDHARAMNALELLRCSPEPVLLRGVRLLLAPGLWEDFDVVYSQLSCGGAFGHRPPPCEQCGLVLVSMRERAGDEWVETEDVLGVPAEPAQEEALTAMPAPAVVPEPITPAAVPLEDAQIARDALTQKWRECEALLDQVRWVRQRTMLPGDSAAGRHRRPPRRGALLGLVVLGMIPCGFALILIDDLGLSLVALLGVFGLSVFLSKGGL